MAKEFYKEAFQYAMEELKKEYQSKKEEDIFSIWFNMTYVSDTVNAITVSVASSFLKTMMSSKGCFGIVEKKLEAILGRKISIECIISNEEKSAEKNEKDEPKDDKKDSKPNFDKEINSKNDEKKIKESIFPEDEETKNNANNSGFKKHPLLQENFTFDTFIPGENSNFAYNASLAVAKKPGKEHSPILFYGGSGLGKTHLMQAIGNYIYNHGGEKLKICYISAESFTNEFILSTKEGKTNAFKNKYRNLDVLLLDDIHFLQNKEATQEELFYTFNALHDKQAQMVFTCDRPIKEIKNMTERLVSRVANGLCIDITIPNYETRVAILKKKLELIQKELDPEIIDYIAKNVETNVRELESALKQILAYADIIEKKPTLEMARNQLKDIFNNSVQNVSLDIIQKVIADNYQISISDLKSKKRDKKYVFPRHIAIYITRELTEISYSEIGNEFGGRDHGTIMHAYEKIADSIKMDSNLESKINLLMREIKEYKK